MTNFQKLFYLILIFPLFLTSCQTTDSEEDEPENAQIKYVFYFIGDGMGFSHVQLTEAYMHSLDNVEKPGFKTLSFDTLPIRGIATTHANNRLITGSAAAGTALATGHKTNIGRISKSPDGNDNYKSIAYRFQEEGFKIGIATSVSIDHATPAVFYANQDLRKYYYSIGRDLVESDFNFFGGGGFKYADSIASENLYDLTKAAGYQIIRDEIDPDTLMQYDKLFFVNPVLGGEADMPYAIDRKYDGGYSLADITRAGIKQLDNETGFFFMIEGGKIDWASHENDAATIVHEVIDFDLAVQEALEFYLKHPDETLIVITADHETGGLCLGNSSKGYDTDFALLKEQKMSYYRISQYFKDKSNDPKKMKELFGVDNLSDWELSMVQSSRRPQDNPDYHMDYGSYHPYLKTYNHIVNLRAGVGFTNWSHTAAPVPVYVIGGEADVFAGKYDNTDIPKKIMKSCGIDF